MIENGGTSTVSRECSGIIIVTVAGQESCGLRQGFRVLKAAYLVECFSHFIPAQSPGLRQGL